MKKGFENFAFLLTLVLCLAFVSCEKDGDKIKNQFVGKWQSNHYSGGVDYYTFTSDGKYTWEGPTSSWGTDYGIYTYNSELKTLIITSQKGNHPEGRTTITNVILEINDEYFIILDNDGDSYTYFKVGDVNNNNSSNIHNKHEYVDMGLSVKWATCNVGAKTPEDYGYYYAWGETETKTEYTEENSITHGKVLGDISGDPIYDTARANWGGDWRMPTISEIIELVENCKFEFVTQNGVNGYKVISNKNGNNIFLPCAGAYNEDYALYGAGEKFFIWSSSVCDTDDFYDTKTARCLSNETFVTLRFYGLTVRPVFD
ncbi:MAG: hypothetical protein IJE18_00915 [Bacteroidaceae bacterium]|nr:hypothetical protein [Bacteroidaceae bacterium]